MGDGVVTVLSQRYTFIFILLGQKVKSEGSFVRSARRLLKKRQALIGEVAGA